jgi:hypothetical protein
MKIKILGTRREVEDSLPYHSKHIGKEKGINAITGYDGLEIELF